MTDSKRRGRKPGTDKLNDSARRALLDGLRSDTGPVNLKATAMSAGISRPTLMRYIAAEPGLQEALDHRREAAGRGYVKVKRAPKASPKDVAAPAKPSSTLPSGSAAKLFAKLWRGLAVEHHWDQQTQDWSRGAEDLSDSTEEPRRQHHRHALAQAEVFQALADGSLDSAAAKVRLDELPKPAPLYVRDPAVAAQEQAADEKVAQGFKAIYGYRPSARRIAELRGKPGRSFAPGEWDEQMAFRKVAAAMEKAADLRKPRKSYPPRPKDANGHPLVPRGFMAKLLREQEAKGLSGQAAKDAAIAAALAFVASASRSGR